jgi:hypothetical protein
MFHRGNALGLQLDNILEMDRLRYHLHGMPLWDGNVGLQFLTNCQIILDWFTYFN